LLNLIFVINIKINTTWFIIIFIVLIENSFLLHISSFLFSTNIRKSQWCSLEAGKKKIDEQSIHRIPQPLRHL